MRLNYRLTRLEARLQSNQAPGPAFLGIVVELLDDSGSLAGVEEYGLSFNDLRRKYTVGSDNGQESHSQN